MTEFQFSCPQCSQHIQCNDHYSGMQIDCPVCKKSILVPPVPPAAAAPPVQVKSPTLRNILVIAVSLMALAAAVVGIWWGYSKIGSHKLPGGLVAYYPFNGNAEDASGHGINGQVNGASPCKDRFGIADAALRFNGVGDYISFTSVPLKKLNNWSLSAWINPASIHQNSLALYLGYDNGKRETGNGFAFGITDGNYNTGNHLGGVLGGVTWMDSGYSFKSPNVWYHIVLLRKDGVTKFYVNGVRTQNTYKQTPLAPTAFTIGSASGMRFFNGMIDDVCIYDRALSDSEIHAVYRARE